MKNKIHPIILFLDEDFSKSAQYLTNKYLFANIKNCCQVLICAIFYNVGIRSKRIYKYYFSKERKTESLKKFFPNWPLKNIPNFVYYNSQEAKWCRKCQNHFDVILKYFEKLLDEYLYRFGHEHYFREILEFMQIAPMEYTLKFGIRILYIDNLKIVLPWKNLPVKYRKRDIIDGYRSYYNSQILNPISDFEKTKRDVPDFVVKNNILNF